MFIILFVFVQALVVELQSPGRFFLLAQNPELLEVLHSITVELQKTYSGSPPAMAYIPSLGEVCAVQFSSDMVSRGHLQQLDKRLKY